MARRRAESRKFEMPIGRRTESFTELDDVNVVSAQVDAKLFGRLRLLSLEARVVAGKPAKRTEGATRLIPDTSPRRAAVSRRPIQQKSGSGLGHAVELCALSSEILEGIRTR